MDADLSSFADDRVAAAIPLTRVSAAGTAGDYRERPMPVGAAILWTPAGLARANPAYPIFITQHALDAVHAQLAGLPEGGGASSLGFLVGGMYHTPDTRIPYIVVESTIHLPWSIAGDHLEAALRQGRVIAQEEARRRGDQLLGWYHSNVAAHARLSGSDVEAHVACFDQPWHVALVVARGTELTGGLFRITSGAAASNDYLPFYELPEGDDLFQDGRAATHLTWANYHTHEIALTGGLVSQPMAAGPPLVLFPDDDDADPDRLPAAGPPAPRLLPLPVARVARFGALGLVAGGALFGAYRVLSSGPGGAAPLEASAVVAPDDVQRLADSAAFAVAAYDLRTRLFEARKMACTDLARGLVEVENRWIEYNGARRSISGGAALDAAQAAKDRRLHADVGAVEQRFARTRCPRP